MDAAVRTWARALEELAIPEDILAAAVGVADVVVSRSVAYNVPDLDGFVTELTARATHRSS